MSRNLLANRTWKAASRSVQMPKSSQICPVESVLSFWGPKQPAGEIQLALTQLFLATEWHITAHKYSISSPSLGQVAFAGLHAFPQNEHVRTKHWPKYLAQNQEATVPMLSHALLQLFLHSREAWPGGKIGLSWLETTVYYASTWTK